jgi:hypothetical protein
MSVNRRDFVKGAIATGAAVSSSAYLLRRSDVAAASPLVGNVERLITLRVNGQEQRVTSCRKTRSR